MEEKSQFKERKRIMFLGLPWTFTEYRITQEMINIKRGLFKTIEDDCYMYKIQDVSLETTLFERILKLGTVVCHTGDTTHPILRLSHIRNAADIKNAVFIWSEQERRKRRTLNTLDIGAGDMDSLEGDFE